MSWQLGPVVVEAFLADVEEMLYALTNYSPNDRKVAMVGRAWLMRVHPKIDNVAHWERARTRVYDEFDFFPTPAKMNALLEEESIPTPETDQQAFTLIHKQGWISQFQGQDLAPLAFVKSKLEVKP